MRFGTSYMGNYYPEAIRYELEDIRKLGFDEVVLACQENDFMHFNGKIRFTPGIAHELGLKVLVNLWGFASAFGGGRISRLVADFPETMVVDKRGRPCPIEWPKGNVIQPGCPNHPRVVERARDFAKRAIDAGVDGFFWDEPTKFDCYCSECRMQFTERFGGHLDSAPAEKVEAFRRWGVVHWVEQMSDWVKKTNPKLVTSTCVMPQDRDAWEDAGKVKSLDSLGTDTYWIMHEKTMEWAREGSFALVEAARKAKKSPHLWIECCGIPKGRETELVEGCAMLSKAAPDTLYVWAYRGQLGTSEACEDPGRAWACLLDGFRAAGMKGRGQP